MATARVVAAVTGLVVDDSRNGVSRSTGGPPTARVPNGRAST